MKLAASIVLAVLAAPAPAGAEELLGLWRQVTTLAPSPGNPGTDPALEASRFYFNFKAAGAFDSVVQIGLQNLSTPGSYEISGGRSILIAFGDEDMISGAYALSPGRLEICPTREEGGLDECIEFVRPNPLPVLRTGPHAVPRMRGRIDITAPAPIGPATGTCEFNSVAQPTASPFPARYDQPMGNWSCALASASGRPFNVTILGFQTVEPPTNGGSYTGQIQVTLGGREVLRTPGFQLNTQTRDFSLNLGTNVTGSLRFSAQNL